MKGDIRDVPQLKIRKMKPKRVSYHQAFNKQDYIYCGKRPGIYSQGYTQGGSAVHLARGSSACTLNNYSTCMYMYYPHVQIFVKNNKEYGIFSSTQNPLKN